MCVEAADIPPLDAVELTWDVEDRSQFEQAITPSAMAHAVLDMCDLAIARQTAYKLVTAKIRDPSLTLSRIASSHGVGSKQLAHYHIMAFCRECPAVFDALLFDRRYQRHIASKYYRETPRWLRPENRRRKPRKTR